jgi:hypothetical protein
MVGTSRNRYMAGIVRSVDKLSDRSRGGKRRHELLHECGRTGIRHHPSNLPTHEHPGGAIGTRAAVTGACTNPPHQ